MPIKVFHSFPSVSVLFNIFMRGVNCPMFVGILLVDENELGNLKAGYFKAALIAIKLRKKV